MPFLLIILYFQYLIYVKKILQTRTDAIIPTKSAINDAINATTSEAKNLALMSIKGRTTGLVMPIKEKIADPNSLELLKNVLTKLG